MSERCRTLALIQACHPYTHTLLGGVHEEDSGRSGPPVTQQENTALLSGCGLAGTPLHVPLLGLGGKERSVYELATEKTFVFPFLFVQSAPLFSRAFI